VQRSRFRLFPQPARRPPGRSLEAARPRRRLAGCESAFTLLELLLVLFVVGLLAAVLIPRFTTTSHARLKSAAARISATARHLAAEAAFTGRPYRLHYDLDRHRCWVTVLARRQDSVEFVRDRSPLTRPLALAPDIAFVNVTLPSSGVVTSGQVFTHFYPQGYTDPTVIHLGGRDGRFYTVVIPPLTGEPRTIEGYVDP